MPHMPISMRPIIILIWLTLVCGGPGIARAQPTMPIDQSFEAYNTLQGWVRAWEMPEAGTSESRTAPVCAAVVTLRVDGHVFGRGGAASPDPSPTLVWEAAKQAIDSASNRLTSERDAMWEAYIKQLSARITISLELTDKLVPVSSSELELPGFGYSPGVRGVAVRRGEQTRVTGTESMLMRETDLAQSAMALANAISGAGDTVLKSPRELAAAGYSFYRFEPLVLAQPAPGLGPVFTDRGGRVVESSEITTGSIDALAERVAGHLMSRRWSGVERYGLTGTLDPVTGTVESKSASPFEQAISAYALLRYGGDGLSKPRQAAVVAGREILGDLAVVELSETKPWEDPVGASMTVIALSRLPLDMILRDKELDDLRLRCLEQLDTLYSEKSGFAPALPEPAWGLVAHALVCSAAIDPRDRTALAKSAIGRAFLGSAPGALAAQMPFLAWAQLEQAGKGGEIPTRQALTAMRDTVWEHQLHRNDLSWSDRDLAGGIVFTSAKAPLPSWVTMRPLAALATMMGDERLTPGDAGSGEVPTQITRVTDSVRFVRQLCAQGPIMHLYSADEDARWGVRMALWDQRMPVEVDAMALLVLGETQQSFASIMERSTP